MDKEIILKLLSTVCILIPLGYSLNLQKAGKTFRLFAVFLIFGFLLDVLAAFHHLVQPIPNIIIENRLPLYSLFESQFFLWLITYKSPFFKLKISGYLSYIYFTLWLILVVLPLLTQTNSLLNIFDSIYQVTLAFLASYALLKMVEKYESLTSNYRFWLILGVFFYCLTTFLMALLKNSFYQEVVWPIHNVLNIITYLLYTKGFIIANQTEKV